MKKRTGRGAARGLLIGGAVALMMSGAAYADPITVVSWGGTYGAAQDNALFNDASKNTGIEINRESGASMSKACLQVESKAVTWDLVVTGSGGAAAAAAKGCLAPFMAMTNREQAEVYVDKIGKNLNPSSDPLRGLHSFDAPTADLPTGY